MHRFDDTMLGDKLAHRVAWFHENAGICGGQTPVSAMGATIDRCGQSMS